MAQQFQKGFAALAGAYFSLIPTGKAKALIMQMSDAVTKEKMLVNLPEFDPVYRVGMYAQDSGQRAKKTVKIPAGKSFLYRTIPLSSPSSIRLVTVRPGTHASPIECLLFEASLNDHPSYEALSYTWGDPTPNSVISINGFQALITDNLYLFLKRARSTTEPRTYWIDGICIDQSSDDDKARQILLMKDIYRQADSVRIWLGEETDGTESAFSLASELAVLSGEVDRNRFLTPEDMTDRKTGLLRGEANWKGLDIIYWLPWWSRTWVIQEITLARRAVVQCGSFKVPWTHLVVAANFLLEHSLFPAVDIDPSPVIAMQVYRDALEQRGGLSLLELMFISRSSRCSDPKDKIYGLLAIASDAGDPVLKPKYEHNVEEIYRDITMFFIRKDNNLCVLNAVEDYKWRTIKGLPSWVPDWTSHPRSSPFLSQPDRWRFSAAGDSILIYSVSGSTLTIKGKVLDTIANVGSPDIPVRSPYPGLRDTPYIRRTIALGAAEQRKHWEKMALKLSPYPTGESVESALWHTIIAEGHIDEEAVPDGHERMYRCWKDRWEYLLNHRFQDLPDDEDLEDKEYATLYNSGYREAFRFRRFATTQKGYMGLVSYSTRPGDKACLLYGGTTVYMLRRRTKGKEERWRFIGEAYFRGLMHGEGLGAGFGEETEFAIV